jgi:hypothetical protein
VVLEDSTNEGAGLDGSGGGVDAVIGVTGVGSTTSGVVVASNISASGLVFAA